MTINEHVDQWMGQVVRNFVESIDDPSPGVWRLALDYEAYEGGTRMAELIEQMANDEHADKVVGLVIGAWDFEMDATAGEVVIALVNHKDRFPNLRGIFLGDITYEEQECSWIQQANVTPLLTEFPDLEHFRVRGSEGLGFDKVTHAHLKSLSFETGGLPSQVVATVLTCEFPELESLKFWIGTDNYGWDGDVSTFAPLLEQCPFPKLKRLGLRNSEIADEIAHAIAEAPVLDQLDELDLSNGVLSDHGAEPLLESKAVKKLKRLDLHYHFLTSAMMDKLRALGPEVNLDEAQAPDGGSEDDRYIMLSE